MAPTIHFIRHGEAAHNVNADLNLHDPKMTPKGFKQCEQLTAEIAGLGHDFELVFASPMKRTIQTALIAFPKYLQSKKIILLSDLQEIGTYAADTGSSIKDLEDEFGTARLNYSLVQPCWTDKSPGTRYHISNCVNRARVVRLFLKSVAQTYRDTDAHIAVVSHGNLLGYMSHPVADFKNCDRRTYRFEDGVDAELMAKLIETPDSIARHEKKMKEAIPQGEFKNPFGVKIPLTFSGPATPSPSWLLNDK
ncbi:hypothetical protein GQX73_g3993 [Xylaria multiplex]|uniref:Uncharacterized protein n=1 Tax=Xylaria multiplex TaxID=323545 RepID=A0A7C8MSP6_9PEZI|nr:hypothetical protein GQX73_g3993 [Xylaria multiplex]